MWQGPYDPRAPEAVRYDLVFLTGLQQDFDRMRQLSWFFRRIGAIVVAGGNICTMFPEFAAQFFDSVCVGGVEAVFDVMRDYEDGRLQPIYRARARRVGAYPIAYHLLAQSAIDLPLHLIETSRGCSFSCSFCVLPAEGSRHAAYAMADVQRAIDCALATAPRRSFRRLFPLLWFIDNNFSDNPRHLREVCAMLAQDRRVRGWGALVTQNTLRNRELIRLMAAAKCRALFAGIESFDRDFLKASRKLQNLSKHQSVVDDIVFAERQGIVITWPLLFDPRSSSIEGTKELLRNIARAGRIPLPCFFSFVSPLAGTALFWESVAAGELRPGMRLRDLDGETLAFCKTREAPGAIAEFARLAFFAPHRLLPRRLVLWNILRRMIRARCTAPLSWILAFKTSARMLTKAAVYASEPRSHLGGEDRLDPQYCEYPEGISDRDRERYFAPLPITDAAGGAAEWLLPYRPKPEHPTPRAERNRIAVEASGS